MTECYWCKAQGLPTRHEMPHYKRTQEEHAFKLSVIQRWKNELRIATHGKTLYDETRVRELTKLIEENDMAADKRCWYGQVLDFHNEYFKKQMGYTNERIDSEAVRYRAIIRDWLAQARAEMQLAERDDQRKVTKDCVALLEEHIRELESSLADCDETDRRAAQAISELRAKIAEMPADISALPDRPLRDA